jgi:hypothetical protein
MASNYDRCRLETKEKRAFNLNQASGLWNTTAVTRVVTKVYWLKA